MKYALQALQLYMEKPLSADTFNLAALTRIYEKIHVFSDSKKVQREMKEYKEFCSLGSRVKALCQPNLGTKSRL